MSEHLLSIEDLNVTFTTDAGDVDAVKGVSLSVDPGEVLAVVGESGSGKTVTAKTILRLLPETAVADGAVLVSGDNVLKMTPAQLTAMRGRKAAMVFQEPSTALNPVFPVGWQITEGLRAHDPKASKKDLRARAVEAMEKVGIPQADERFDYYPHQFSGGQKQRIVIAMALALGADLVIADEPTTALDVTVQSEILDLMRSLKDEFSTGIVLITHNMGVVADLADRVAVMYRGELVEVADVRSLFANPQHEYTKSLLAAVPKIRTLKSGPATGTEPTGTSAADRTAADVGKTAQQADPFADAKTIVKARGLEITYRGGFGKPDFQAIKGVDFDIREGEVYGLVGESGSGKTTIGRAIAGLTRASGGSLEVFGQEMVGFKEKEFKPLREKIGFVFQDPAASFNPHLSIGDCIAEPFRVHRPRMSERDRRSEVVRLLDAVQLPGEYADRYPHELSGGQRQRCSLARGLALQPELVVADEPTSALDVSVQARVLELFTQLQDEFGFAALFISHDLAVVDMLSDRLGVLFHGDLLEEGTGEQVLGAPQHTYTQRLIASLPVPDPVEQESRRKLARTLRG
ncbi:glutathione ABC transporter ATP-binding protein [Brevibacterium ravenspurgense]|uniref:Glutathione ABC transporter ATP-binding protein n=1 Tax=Brevibacterium ravenspurgense TaxID=479117 RepID=A0A2I1IHD1_9MICO|nr:ABC transporter ATP-binding protein [Brevibacterium ravenspurgense]PKY70530.1 glutathione ABC transporter ATP-binding protein [Brevibacterium ravenspurgense]